MHLPPPLDLLPPLLDGLRTTLRLTVGGIAVGVVCALLAGLGRGSRLKAVRAASSVYVETFRGTSALVQLFWFYFALPAIGVRLSAELAGVLVLGLNGGAYGAEVVRGALGAVPVGQLEAARALGLGPLATLWRIQLPQAAVAMLPPAGNLAIELLKNTSLVSMITLSELTFQGQLLRASTLRTTEIFALLLALYFVLAQLLRQIVRSSERALARGRQRPATS